MFALDPVLIFAGSVAGVGSLLEHVDDDDFDFERPLGEGWARTPLAVANRRRVQMKRIVDGSASGSSSSASLARCAGLAGTVGAWKIGVDLQPEARQLALLEVVVDEEADADGQWNEGSRGSGEDFAILHDDPEYDEEQGDADTDGDEDNAGAAGVAETAERIFGWAGVVAGRAEETFDLCDGHAAGDHGHALLGFDAGSMGRGPDACDDDYNGYDKCADAE